LNIYGIRFPLNPAKIDEIREIIEYAFHFLNFSPVWLSDLVQRALKAIEEILTKIMCRENKEIVTLMSCKRSFNVDC